MKSTDSQQERLETLCRRVGVVRLDLFGSAARGAIEPGDLDVLVQFDEDSGGLFDRYFELKEGLEAIFGKPVDVVVERAIRNPYFRETVGRERRVLYAA